MSKGPGKIEKKIIEYLNKPGFKSCNIAELCYFIEGDINGPGDEWPSNKNIDQTGTRYKSVYRAVKSLENKGYLITEKVNPHGEKGCLIRESNFDYATRQLTIYKC